MERLFKKKIGVRGAIAWQHMSSYLVLKIGYINRTHTHMHKVELKTLYFNFDSPLQKRFLRSISRKRLTIEVSALALDELMVLRAVSQLIMRGHKPKVEYKLVDLYS